MELGLLVFRKGSNLLLFPHQMTLALWFSRPGIRKVWSLACLELWCRVDNYSVVYPYMESLPSSLHSLICWLSWPHFRCQCFLQTEQVGNEVMFLAQYKNSRTWFQSHFIESSWVSQSSHSRRNRRQNGEKDGTRLLVRCKNLMVHIRYMPSPPSPYTQ